VSAELPGTGKRFEGLLPPVATAPCFAIRKAAVAVFTLEDYAKAGVTLTPNLVSLCTKDGVASLSDLVRSALRLRPDRIPIGEVRGAEALDLIKAWGTGHPGGIGTIHAISMRLTRRRPDCSVTRVKCESRRRFAISTRRSRWQACNGWCHRRSRRPIALPRR